MVGAAGKGIFDTRLEVQRCLEILLGFGCSGCYAHGVSNA